VLGGRLWHPACQAAANSEAYEKIALSFTSLDDYIATLDPLVLEEAREVLRSEWGEKCAHGRMWQVEVARCGGGVGGGAE
jgi:hypothetical protein